MVKQKMQRVFVLGADGQALDPCHPARARSLLRERRAAIARRYPFTIILKERMAVESVVHAHAVKIDPGSKTTGMAVVNDFRRGGLGRRDRASWSANP